MPLSSSEVEVKIAIPSVRAGRQRLRGSGFQIHVPRHFEANMIWDTRDFRMRSEGKVVRIRLARRQSILTFKGRSADTHHKVREEIETRVEDAAVLERILRELDLVPVFRYEKYRTEYADGKSHGLIMLDETPIGCFLEIEGRPRWIDHTARQLGFGLTDYITASYGALYAQYCCERGIQPSNMIFDRK